MKKRITAAILACAMAMLAAVSLANEAYNYIDPSIVIGADRIPWVTVAAKNDQPMNDGETTGDKVFLDETGEKIAMPEDPDEWAAWLDDICVNKTNGKGDLAFCKMADEGHLRVLNEVDDTLYMDYTRHEYSDFTRVWIKGLKAYLYWNTDTDGVQRGAKVVYDDETGIFTVSEFNMLTMDGSYDDVMAAVYFGFIRYSCNYKANTQTTGLFLREVPSGEGTILANIPKGAEIDAIYDYSYPGDNGYDYSPVRYKIGKEMVYGWVARDFLGMNDHADAITWIGRVPTELEYPSAEEIIAAEGLEPVAVAVTVGNDPANGEFFTEGENILFKVETRNNTFTGIARAEITDERAGGDMVFTVPWRSGRIAEYEYTVTAQDAAAGYVEQISSVVWTDDVGEHTTVSEPVRAAAGAK